MDIGWYAAASAGVYQMQKLEVQNNNLANINTVGFKRQILTADQEQFDQTLAAAVVPDDPYAAGDQSQVPNVTGIKARTDFSPGPIKNTGNPLDVALKSAKDFFVVNTPEGPAYTRAGNFTTNGTGELVTQDGFQVQGDGGAIQIGGPGASISIDGSVRVQGQTIARLQVVRFEDPSGLEHIAGTRFKVANSASQPVQVEPMVEPMALEMSNVSAITGMVDLITTSRAFEAYTKAATAIDSLNTLAITQVGRRAS
jgi:flagellar basal-body rod protein FlgF